MTNAELFAAVSRWVAVNYGMTAEHLSIRVRGLVDPIALPILTASPAAPTDDEKGRGLSPCILDILAVLREVKRPLSRTRLLEEMAKRGMEYSERTVAGYLARLVQDGTLENPEDARPRGYRLPVGDA